MLPLMLMVILISIDVLFISNIQYFSIVKVHSIPYFYSAYFCKLQTLRRIKYKRLANLYVRGHSRARHQQRHQGEDGIKEGRSCQKVRLETFPE